MNYLLDTHVLPWARGAPRRLAQDVRALVEDEDSRELR